MLNEKYIELINQTYLLNRIHNSDELVKTLNYFDDFCKNNLRGKSKIHYYKPGTVHNYWIVPKRWNLKSFSLVDPKGNVIATEKDHPLVVGAYSRAINQSIELSELKKKIISREDMPDAYLFYVRSMYRHWENDWYISLPFNQLKNLVNGTYQIHIDAEFNEEPMPIFEYFLKGKTEKTIFLTGHIDHPGQINDSISGCISSINAIENIEKNMEQTEYSYRILLVPEIIASAIYLKNNENQIKDTFFAFCPNMTSHDAPLAMCYSKSQSSLLDIALHLALKESNAKFVIGSFHQYPDCGDEISFDAAGYNIPTPTLSRIGEMFKKYHTSLDNISNFLTHESQERYTEFVNVMTKALLYIEKNKSIQINFSGNPCLSNPDLNLYLSQSNVGNMIVKDAQRYDLDGNMYDQREFMEYYLDAIGSGGMSILEIAHSANIPFDLVLDYTNQFQKHNLIDLNPVNRRMKLDKVSSVYLKGAEGVSKQNEYVK